VCACGTLRATWATNDIDVADCKVASRLLIGILHGSYRGSVTPRERLPLDLLSAMCSE
jgi:hypothetical protein